jgi:hypothetical protein
MASFLDGAVAVPVRRSSRDATAPAAAVPREILAIIAVLSVVPAAIHVWVAPAHFAEWWGYGTFFVAAAAGELAFLGLLAWRPSRGLVLLGIFGSLETVLMYLVSRTAGIPFGPAAGEVEGVEILGITATLAEAALVVALFALLSGQSRRWTVNSLCAVGLALWIAALAGVLAPGPEAVPHTHGKPGGHNPGYPYGEGPLPAIPDSVRNAPRPPGIG